MPPLQPGSLLLNRYAIQETLGQGGFGVVYKALDQSLDVLCAIKENLNLSAQSEKQFKREAELLATLRHRYLPRVTNHFLLDNKQYLVMDFVEGEDLRQRLERQGALPEVDVLRWLQQVSDALFYLHNLPVPVIHRDIKPANIKITPAGDAILVDFGIAKVGTSSERTATGALGLTPGFAPPEQYNSGGTDARTDVYALGATYYNLLTNSVPPDSLQRLMQFGKMEEPRHYVPNLSPNVNAAILKAMEPNAAQRFGSVVEFLGALKDPAFRYTPTKTANARRGRSEATTQPLTRSRPFWAAIGCTIVLATSLGILLILAALGAVSLANLNALLTGRVPTAPSLALSPATATLAPPTATADPGPTAPPLPSATASPAPTPTPPPIPQPISPANAIGWRLYSHWQLAGNPTDLKLSPDGQQIAYLDGTTVLLCKLISGKCDSPAGLRSAFPNPDFQGLAFFEDALLLLRQEEVIEVNPGDGSVIARFPQTGQDFSLSPDRRFFVIREKRLNVYDLSGCLQKKCRQLMSIGDPDQKYAFAPDGSLIAVVNDNYVDLWSTDKRTLVGRLFGHGEPIADVVFTPDNHSLVAASGDIWDLVTLKLSGYFDSATTGITLNLDGQVILGRDGDVWDFKTGQRLGSVPAGGEDVTQEFFTPDGLFLVRRLASGEVQLWVSDTSAAPPLVPTAPPVALTSEPITAQNISRLAVDSSFAALSANGLQSDAAYRRVVTWYGNVAQILDLPSQTQLTQISVDGTILDASFLGDQFLLVATSRGVVERWDIARQKLMQRYDLAATEVVGSSRGDLFAVSLDSVVVIDSRTGKDKYKLAKSNGPHSFLFTHDGGHLLIASGSAVVQWALDSGKQEKQQYLGHSRLTLGLSLTPDGVWLTSGSGDVWQVESGQRQIGVDMKAATAALTPDGQLLLGGDGSLWEVSTAQYLGHINLSATQMVLLPDARRLLILGSQSLNAYRIEDLPTHVAATLASGQPALSLKDLALLTLPDLHLVGWWGNDNLIQAQVSEPTSGLVAHAYGTGPGALMVVNPDGMNFTVLEAQGLSMFNPVTGDQIDQYHIFLNPDDIQEFTYLGQDVLLRKGRAGLERWNLSSQTLVQRYKLYGTQLTASPDGRYFALEEQPAYVSIYAAETGQQILKFHVSEGTREFAFSSDGNWLAINTGQLVELHALPDGAMAQTLRSHTGHPDNLQFTADSRKLVAGSGDVWEVATGQRMDLPRPFELYALSPSSDYLASADGSFWSLETGQRVATNYDLRDTLVQLLFADQGNLLLGRTVRSRILVWGIPVMKPLTTVTPGPKSITPANASTLQLSSYLNRGRLEDAIWSLDGNYLAMNTSQNVIVYEAATFKRINAFLDSRAVAFNSAGQLLLSDQTTLRLVEPRTGQEVKTLDIAYVQQARFSADDHLLAISQFLPAPSSETVAVVDLNTSQVTMVEQGLYTGLQDIRFLPGSGWLMASFRGVIAFWSYQSGQWQLARPLLHGNVGAPDVSPDGSLLAYFTASDRLALQDIQRGFEVRTIGTELFPSALLLPYYIPLDFSFLGNNQLVIFYREKNRNSGREVLTTKIWTLSDGTYSNGGTLVLPLTELTSLYADSYSLHNRYRFPSVVMSPTRTRFYTATSDGIMRTWSYPSGQVLAISRTDSAPLMALSLDGQTVAVPNAQQQIEILSVSTGEIIGVLPYAWQLVALRYLDRNLLAILGQDGKLSLVLPLTGTVVETYRDPNVLEPSFFDFALAGRLRAAWGRVASRDRVNLFPLSPSETPLLALDGFSQADTLIFTRDGKQLAVVKNGMIQLWDLQTAALLRELKGNHRDYGTLIMTPDGTRLIAATGEVWNLADGSLVGTFASTTRHIVLSPDGQLIVGDEGTLWDATSLQPIDQLRGLRERAVNLAFTPDGQALLWQNQEGFIEVWRLP